MPSSFIFHFCFSSTRALKFSGGERPCMSVRKIVRTIHHRESNTESVSRRGSCGTDIRAQRLPVARVARIIGGGCQQKRQFQRCVAMFSFLSHSKVRPYMLVLYSSRCCFHVVIVILMGCGESPDLTCICAISIPQNRLPSPSVGDRSQRRWRNPTMEVLDFSRACPPSSWEQV